MKQAHQDYLLFLKRKEKFNSAIDSLGDAFERLDLIEEVDEKFRERETDDQQPSYVDIRLVDLILAIVQHARIEVHADSEIDEEFCRLVATLFPADHAVHKYVDVVGTDDQ